MPNVGEADAERFRPDDETANASAARAADDTNAVNEAEEEARKTEDEKEDSERLPHVKCTAVSSSNPVRSQSACTRFTTSAGTSTETATSD